MAELRESPGRQAFCAASPTSRRRPPGCCWNRTCWSERRPVRRSSRSSAVAARSDVLFDRQTAEASAEIDPGVDIEAITELFLDRLADNHDDGTWNKTSSLARIGAVALATKTVPETVRREVIAQRLPSHDWPDRVLRVTAIDTATGEFVVFDRDSGVGLIDAVAASCAVPGAWPPVTIAGPALHGRRGQQLGQCQRGRRLRCGRGVGAFRRGCPVAVRSRAGRRDRRLRRPNVHCVRRR